MNIVQNFIVELKKNSSYNISIYGIEKVLRKAAFYPKPLGLKINTQHSGAWSKYENKHFLKEISKFGNLPFLTYQSELKKMWEDYTQSRSLIIPHPINFFIKQYNKKQVSSPKNILFLFNHTYYGTQKGNFKRDISKYNDFTTYEVSIFNYHRELAVFSSKYCEINSCKGYISLHSHDDFPEIRCIYEKHNLKIAKTLDPLNYEFLESFIKRALEFDVVVSSTTELSSSYFHYQLGIEEIIFDLSINYPELIDDLDFDEISKINDNEGRKKLFAEYYSLDKWSIWVRIHTCLFLYYCLLLWIIKYFYTVIKIKIMKITK